MELFSIRIQRTFQLVSTYNGILRKQKKGVRLAEKPQGICYWGYLILGVIGKPFL